MWSTCRIHGFHDLYPLVLRLIAQFIHSTKIEATRSPPRLAVQTPAQTYPGN